MHVTSIYKKFLAIFLTLLVMLLLVGFGANPGRPEEITATGIIKKQGITTYMYGTHVLLDDDGQTLYALKSDTIDLNKYLNRKVKIKGSWVAGYPVDSGPNYLNVKFIE